MAYQNGPRIVTNGLVLCLDAGNSKSYAGSGTSWTDLSGNGNNGTLTNGPTFSSSNKGGIVFDGTNDYVNCGAGSSTDFNGLKNMTVSAWLYPTAATATNSNVISKVWQWYMNFHTDRKIRFGFYHTGGATVAYTNTALTLNAWYYSCWTYNGTSCIAYINGISDNSFAMTNNLNYGAPYSASCNVLIGAEANFCSSPETRYFAGRIASAQIYNRALSASEVLQNYNATKGRFGL